MYYDWENKFEEIFELKDSDTSELKVIIGQQPYKIKLNDVKFEVSHFIYPYNKLGNSVAFLVTNWIKIQDSLEMIFNLLFKNNINGLKVLCFLRENNVDAQQFAQYLYRKYSIILTNSKLSNDIDNMKNIKELVEEINKPTYFLLVGNIARKDYTRVMKVEKIQGVAYFIHPSGMVLNNRCNSNKYYKNWYSLKGNNVQEQDVINKFILSR